MRSAPAAIADRGSTPEARVLLASLHQDRTRLGESGIENLSADQWARLVTLAGEQRVRPLVHQRLLESERWRQAPAEIWQRLEGECRAIALRKIRMHAELAAILGALAELRIPAIVLKGAFLGPAVYRNIALREMNDLDIMVPRDQLRVAVELAAARGYAGVHPFSVEADARAGHHVTRLVKAGVTGLEFHWNIVSPHEPTAIAAEALWQTARPVQINGIEALCLSREDLLLHLGVHASFLHQFEFGLRPACDMAHVIAHYGTELDWDVVLRMAHGRGWARGVAVALQLARDFAGADVPQEAIRRMAPGDLGRPVELATQLAWSLPTEIRAFSVSLAPLVGGESLGRGLAAVCNRILLPRTQLTALYGIAESSPWWRLLYGYRALDLVRRHAATAARLLAGRDGTVNELARRRNNMRAWLSQS